MYREVNKGLYVVGRNFFLLLLNCSPWVLLSKTNKPLVSPLYTKIKVLVQDDQPQKPISRPRRHFGCM